MVEALVRSNLESEARNQELMAELNAEKHRFRLLAKSQNLPPQDIPSHLLAAELDEEQYYAARGEHVETGPSGSTTAPAATLRTKKPQTVNKDTAQKSNSGKTSTAHVPGTKPMGSTRIPKHDLGHKSTEPGVEKTSATKHKVAPPSKKQRGDREESLRNREDYGSGTRS